MMVRWEGVSHDYGAGDVLHDVTLAVQPGECVALLGPNGAGKTTLTRMLMGLVRPRTGRVSVGD
ncbi:MAG: ATP-binding cassette domain-containing protein, partial [Gemmatimonadales bacterium]